MHGAAILAFLKISRVAFSLSPTYLLSSSGPFIDMKLDSLSVATAFASSVFPVPGAPTRSIPFMGLIPIFSNACGFFIGSSTASFSCAFTSSSPPTSSQWTFGLSTKTSLSALGCMPLNASMKSALVTLRFISISFGTDFLSIIFGSMYPQGAHGRLPCERCKVRAGVSVR